MCVLVVRSSSAETDTAEEQELCEYKENVGVRYILHVIVCARQRVYEYDFCAL